MSTPAQIIALLAAMTVTAGITHHLTRRRTTARHRAAITAAVHAAHRDDLTGLGNRAGFHAALAATRRQITVILINLDGTRTFVGRFGDRALDQLLVLTAGRLQHPASAARGRMFRLRRDEFAVLLDDPADAGRHATGLVAAVAEPTDIQLTGRPITVTVTACAGIAPFSPHADRDRRLALGRADRVLRVAKRAGRRRTAVFDPATMRGLDTAPVSRADGGDVR
ncbi:diguanylate cyclase (GGDEF)-like protein [Micromonospora sp. Llam0]|uniref:GGDEF domain-containing protein n=1 Tax=Micromonospora sp. Llam0 TaxID=2485143 RepID=UPI000F49830A|nr:GGDEF domain-containing protein [Micromonospora sp. Llam0]ROO52755.1 diguanylate cyclase (GGDEF)-like protein [Micromonospora sp. Llam0]